MQAQLQRQELIFRLLITGCRAYLKQQGFLFLCVELADLAEGEIESWLSRFRANFGEPAFETKFYSMLLICTCMICFTLLSAFNCVQTKPFSFIFVAPHNSVLKEQTTFNVGDHVCSIKRGTVFVWKYLNEEWASLIKWFHERAQCFTNHYACGYFSHLHHVLPQTQALNQLGTLGGAKIFLWGAQKLCPTHFSRGANAPATSSYGPAQTYK